MSYVEVKKIRRCLDCGSERTEVCSLHWSIWESVKDAVPEVAVENDEGNVWRLAELCNVCYSRSMVVADKPLIDKIYERLLG